MVNMARLLRQSETANFPSEGALTEECARIYDDHSFPSHLGPSHLWHDHADKGIYYYVHLAQNHFSANHLHRILEALLPDA